MLNFKEDELFEQLRREMKEAIPWDSMRECLGISNKIDIEEIRRTVLKSK
ncbi:MAG: hypothetical protein ACLFQV_07625 [Vulcanimicrobiota bacterium]